MSKAIRWQIHFHEAKPDSQSPKHYRVDIYDETGSWSGITQLMAGDNPFTTTEDNSDDFFCPVRSQTGTLQICTALPGGGTITLNDLLPANNIARPVRVSSIAANNAETIEWQGFLSCEAYSQDYTSIPENISIPVISVLEAMASVEADESKLSGLNTVASTINKLIDIFLDKVGLTMCDEYYMPGISCGRNIVSKYIDATVLFQANEYNNENSTTYIVSGMSIKDCLARIATYMGWCLREKSNALYFEAAGETSGYQRNYRTGSISPGGEIVVTWLTDLTATSVSRANLADQSWRGTGHERSIAAGAKSVEVVANLAKYELNMGLPPFPYVGMVTYSVSMREATVSSYGSNITIGSIASSYTTFSNIYELQSLQLSNDKTTGTATSISNILSQAIINPSSNASASNNYVGAFMARIKKDSGEYQNGLFISTIGEDGYQYIPSTSNYVFRFRSLMQHTFVSGKLRIKMEGLSFYGGDTGRCVVDRCLHYIKLCAIKFGNKYWNGQSWQTSFTTIGYNPLSDDDGYYIPITTSMTGEIVVMLYPNRYDHIIPADYEQGYALGSFLSVLDITYEQDKNDLYTDRGANHYYRLLGTNFRDEISVSTDLASGLNNVPSPSLIMDDSATPMTVLDYGAGHTHRPEVDLLNRLATYYGAARQRLELEVAHPTAAPLPLLRLNGIDDGKVYLPLSESRDWRNDICQLTCFECPT